MRRVAEAAFRRIVTEAVEALPAAYRKHVGQTVEILLADEPGPEHIEPLAIGEGPDRRKAAVGDLVAHGGSYELYGLYHGVPVPFRAGGVYPPATVTVFMGPCLRANADLEGLRFQVRNLVEHELGHHFGLSEEEVALAHRRTRGDLRRGGIGMDGNEKLLRRLAQADVHAGKGDYVAAIGELSEVVRALVERGAPARPRVKTGEPHAFEPDEEIEDRCVVCGGSRANPVHL